MKKEDSDIIVQIQRDFDLAMKAESNNREEMLEDLRFAALDQWPADVQKERAGRMMLTLDHTNEAVRKVLGDIRDNRPSVKIIPADDNSDPDTADVLEGLIRQIEYQSSADRVYMSAASQMVKCGYGVWRVGHEYTRDDAFEQDIVIRSIKNPFSVYFDPYAESPTKDDGRFCLLHDTLSKEAFEAEYGEDVPTSKTDYAIGEGMEGWFDVDQVRICEYWCKKTRKKTLTQLSDGRVLNADEIDDGMMQQFAQQGITPVKNREVDSEYIQYYKVTGFKVLESREWIGRYFPLIPIYGEEENIAGETKYRGIIRAAKDPQRLYNYWNSHAGEAIALQPKAPWLVTGVQIADHLEFWNKANEANLPYLPYTPDGEAPPPQRMMPPTFQAGLMQHAEMMANDIRHATGVFESSLGQKGPETSGRAILAKQSAGDIATSIYNYNLAAGIEQTGRVIVDMIPKIYDTQRVIRVLGEGDKEDFAEINKAMLTPNGMKIINDLTRGKYDVRVIVGPSYRTKRMEAASSMVELARVFPQVLEVAGDLVAKNLDWPGADEMAERLKKLLPPGIAETDDKDPEAQQQIEMQQQQAEQQAQVQMAQLKLAMDEMQAKTDNIKADTHKKMIDAQKTQMDADKIAAELAIQARNQMLMMHALNDVINLLQSNPNAVQEGQPAMPAPLQAFQHVQQAI